MCAQGGRPTKRDHKVVVVELEEGTPPTPKGKAPTPSPKPSKVAKVAAAAPPPPQPLMWGPWLPPWPPT